MGGAALLPTLGEKYSCSQPRAVVAREWESVAAKTVDWFPSLCAKWISWKFAVKCQERKAMLVFSGDTGVGDVPVSSGHNVQLGESIHGEKCAGITCNWARCNCPFSYSRPCLMPPRPSTKTEKGSADDDTPKKTKKQTTSSEYKIANYTFLSHYGTSVNLFCRETPKCA